MKKRKYKISDIELLAQKKITPKEFAEKYGVSLDSVYHLCRREHIHLTKPVIIIRSKYGDTYVRGKQECAEELKISYTSVVRALKGEKVNTLEELGIEIIYAEVKK